MYPTLYIVYATYIRYSLYMIHHISHVVQPHVCLYQGSLGPVPWAGLGYVFPVPFLGVLIICFTCSGKYSANNAYPAHLTIKVLDIMLMVCSPACYGNGSSHVDHKPTLITITRFIFVFGLMPWLLLSTTDNRMSSAVLTRILQGFVCMLPCCVDAEGSGRIMSLLDYFSSNAFTNGEWQARATY